ncbi:MAG: NifU family protein [Rhodothermaceae bacterium]
MLVVQGVDVTPNPNALKFILNQTLLSREQRSFAQKAEAENDPLAKGVFELDGVVSVFYMDKFVTIEKTPEKAWPELQKDFAGFISGFDTKLIPEEEPLIDPENIEGTELLKKINSVLDQRVRPALAADGGGMEIIGLEGLTLSIRYQGACGSCPSAIKGTLVAIENLLKREIHPEINVVPG